MIKKLLIVSILSLFLYSEEPCDRVKLLLREAKVLQSDFNDSNSAIRLLQGGEFGRILYFHKPDCLSEKEYLQALNEYSFYLTKQPQSYGGVRFLENFIKKYSQNAISYYYLGEVYRKLFLKNSSRNSSYREKALNNYKKYLKLAKEQGLKPKKEAIEFVKSRGLKRAKKTWGDFLKPDIPKNRFRAYFLDKSSPKKIVESKIVDKISINYSPSPMGKKDITPKNFSAYWVGEFDFNQTKKMQINISQSWAKTRVIIDGLIVYQGNHSAIVPFEFKKGSHKIEVEFINNWHTVTFSLSITPFTKLYSMQELKKELEKFRNKDFEVWMVGVYESRNPDSTITLNLKKSDKPVILMLGSYETINWKIKNPHKNRILAIIISRSRTVSQLSGEIGDSEIFHTKFSFGGYSIYPKCKCVENIGFQCSNGSAIKQINSILKRILGKKATGFSGKYGVKSLKVPEIILDEKEYKKISEALERVKKLREECSKRDKVDFENMFK